MATKKIIQIGYIFLSLSLWACSSKLENDIHQMGKLMCESRLLVIEAEKIKGDINQLKAINEKIDKLQKEIKKLSIQIEEQYQLEKADEKEMENKTNKIIQAEMEKCGKS